jgi:transposase
MIYCQQFIIDKHGFWSIMFSVSSFRLTESDVIGGRAVRMDVTERSRVLARMGSGEISAKSAAEILGLSERQTQRIWHRYCKEGAGGLQHRNSGRPSNRAFSKTVRQQVLKLYRERFAGSGPTEFAKELFRMGFLVNHETLRRWLTSQDLWRARRRTDMSASSREQERGFGVSVSLVACQDRWLGQGSPPCWLAIMSDDTTGTLRCSLKQEPLRERSAELIWDWIDAYGIPVSLACRKSLLRRRESDLTIEEQLNGDPPETLFAKILDRLGIDAHPFDSAFESRGLSNLADPIRAIRAELTISKVETLEEANALLHGIYGVWLNKHFASDWLEPENYHVPIEDGTQLDDVLSSVGANS